MTDQPDFQFPVVGFSQQVARNDPGDDGVREFPVLKGLLTISMDEEVAVRTGMLLIDSGGRSWEIVAARKGSVVDGWWGNVRAVIVGRQFWIDLEFAEREFQSFDALKTRWHSAIKANPRVHATSHRDLKRATTLSDLIKTEEELATLRRPGSSLWLGDGRGSRLEFVAIAAAFTAVVPPTSLAPMPMVVLGLILEVLVLACGVRRRLHDLNRSGWWILFFYIAWVMPGAVVLQWIVDAPRPRWVVHSASWIWVLSLGAAIGYLALWPGRSQPNRYGRAPRLIWRRRSLSKAAEGVGNV
jgi:uncharacterized membrane protein YhaH (DUF805 family)